MMETKSEQKITPKQSEARAGNAQHSTGPKSPMGKATSSMNAVKWGFLSRQTVLPGESQAEFDDHRAKLFAALKPAGAAEELCAQRVADTSWRLRRCSAIESQIFFNGLCHEQGERETDA